MSFLPTGTVYGTLLNFQAERDALGPRMSQPPHHTAPERPVLYVKPANTFAPHGGSIAVPAAAGQVWVSASIAMLVGPQALGRWSLNAMDNIAGYVLMNDLSLPQPDFFRPPVKYNGWDGFLGLGAQIVPAEKAGDPDAFVLEVRIDGALRQTMNFRGLLRTAARLLADVSEFMTLHPGDLLMLGSDVRDDGQRLSARAGQRIDISAPGFPTLSNTLVAEAA